MAHAAEELTSQPHIKALGTAHSPVNMSFSLMGKARLQSITLAYTRIQ